jgi:hypothetical protein
VKGDRDRIVAALCDATGLTPAELLELRERIPDPDEALEELRRLAAARGTTISLVMFLPGGARVVRPIDGGRGAPS